MPLETGDFIEDLVQSNPTGLDGINEGDDHIRLLKKTIQGSFPGGAGAWNFPSQQAAFLAVDVDAVFTPNVAECAQVSVGLARITGSTGAVVGLDTGLSAVVRTGPGEYEVQMTETGWNQNNICMGYEVNYGFGGIGLATLGTATVNTDGTWIKIITTTADAPAVAADSVEFSFCLFNSGRPLDA